MIWKHGLLAAVETSVEDDLSDTMASCSNIPNGMASLNRSVPLPQPSFFHADGHAPERRVDLGPTH